MKIKNDRWMAASAKGDAGAFRLLARELGPKLFAQAVRLLGGDRAGAEDVLQEVLVKLWTLAPRWEAGGSVGAYASKMVFSVAMDMHRRALPVSGEDVPEEAVPETLTQRVYEDQRRCKVMEALQALPDRQREAIGLAYFYDCKAREVAQAMGTTEKAAEALLVRARKELGKLISPRWKEDLR